MGYDFENEHGEEERFNVFSWPKVLELAEEFGWVPEGTTIEEDGEAWGGTYYSNDGQKVSAEDARNLGEAIMKAMPSVPNEEIVRRITTYHPTSGGSLCRDASNNLLEYFSGEKTMKRLLVAFAVFCHRGAFNIY